ncbi:protein sel-1 homolog 3-like [Eublepharis macularius]|uniref:Protein sel-1 homolog 3-like n=1 Tax=Eublepharis macularius TaxID=481883 RepID=A0AA97KTN8_EUBMA|nr:protein sel-1 homolog 3-like [Eublepharis macularius]
METVAGALFQRFEKRVAGLQDLARLNNFYPQLLQAGCLGYSRALYLISTLHRTGLGLPLDSTKTLKFGLLSAQADDRLSGMQLGHKHHLGVDGLPVDHDLSYAYYANVAAQTVADRELSREGQAFVEHIRLIDEDALKLQTKENDDLFVWLRFQARRGMAEAQQAVSRMLFWGQQGISSKLKEAVKFYEKGAARLKDPTLMYDYGVVLLKGHGVKQDIPKALDLLNQAAEQLSQPWDGITRSLRMTTGGPWSSGRRPTRWGTPWPPPTSGPSMPTASTRGKTEMRFPESLYLNDEEGWFVLGDSKYILGVQGFFGPSSYYRSSTQASLQTEPPKLLQHLDLPQWFATCQKFKDAVFARLPLYQLQRAWKLWQETCHPEYEALAVQQRTSSPGEPRCWQWEAPYPRRRAAVYTLLQRAVWRRGDQFVNMETVAGALFQRFEKRVAGLQDLAHLNNFYPQLLQAGCLGHSRALYLISTLHRTGLGLPLDSTKVPLHGAGITLPFYSLECPLCTQVQFLASPGCRR